MLLILTIPLLAPKRINESIDARSRIVPLLRESVSQTLRIRVFADGKSYNLHNLSSLN